MLRSASAVGAPSSGSDLSARPAHLFIGAAEPPSSLRTWKGSGDDAGTSENRPKRCERLSLFRWYHWISRRVSSAALLSLLLLFGLTNRQASAGRIPCSTRRTSILSARYIRSCSVMRRIVPQFVTARTFSTLELGAVLCVRLAMLMGSPPGFATVLQRAKSVVGQFESALSSNRPWFTNSSTRYCRKSQRGIPRTPVRCRRVARLLKCLPLLSV